MSLTVFIACAPGLEPMLAEELAPLGATGTIVPGGVEARGDLRLVYRANLELGVALKVLVRLGRFRATRFDELSARAAALPWDTWIAGRAHVRAVCRASRLYHSGAVAERVQAAIGERTGDTDTDVLVRLERDECTISVDTSGELLHKRGYRVDPGAAPLREDLARALARLAGAASAAAIIDPCCGAGTLLAEAALLARGTPPGHARRFAFMDAPGFDEPMWLRLRERALARATDIRPRLLGSDRDPAAIEAARGNLARAGIDWAELAVAPLSQAPAFAAPPPGPGVVLANPPYGRRVGRGDTLARLYEALGERVRSLPAGWRVGLVTASRALARATALPLASELMTDHGGGKVYLLTGP